MRAKNRPRSQATSVPTPVSGESAAVLAIVVAPGNIPNHENLRNITGEPYHYILIEDQQYAAELLQYASAQDHAHVLPSLPQDHAHVLPSLPPAVLAEHLSRRERDVLRLIAHGLSNQEIAQSLTLALNTVKMHIKHIYGKLGVNNRIQAVSRALELQML